MARGGIYKSEVIRARESLLAEGRNPTIDAVREALGTGSKTTIHRYLKEIEEEEGGKTGSKIAISEALHDLVGRLASRLQEEADGRLLQLREAHTEEIRSLQADRARDREQADQLRAQLDSAQADGAAAIQGRAEAHDRLRQLELELGRLSGESSGLRDRLKAAEGHERSLEEKHQQAHKSLDHFRAAAKEQREQESRKHDQQVQFLQSELRSVNAALAAKQHEASTAHRENARLLSELAHAQAAERAAVEDAKLHKEQVGELAFAKKKAEELVGRVASLQTENLRLEDGITRQSKEFTALSKQLSLVETELAVKQASLDALREAFALLTQNVKTLREAKKPASKVS